MSLTLIWAKPSWVPQVLIWVRRVWRLGGVGGFMVAGRWRRWVGNIVAIFDFCGGFLCVFCAFFGLGGVLYNGGDFHSAFEIWIRGLRLWQNRYR